MDKLPVLVGIHPTKALEVYRTFEDFDASRQSEIITVNYSEYLLTNGVQVEKRGLLHYVVKNLKAGDTANDLIIIEDFNGFDNWFNYNIGVFPDGTKLGDIIVGSINMTLQSLPIDAPNGFIITQSA